MFRIIPHCKILNKIIRKNHRILKWWSKLDACSGVVGRAEFSNTADSKIIYSRNINANSRNKLILKSYEYSVWLTTTMTLEEEIKLSLMSVDSAAPEPLSSISASSSLQIYEKDDNITVESRMIHGVPEAKLLMHLPYNFDCEIHMLHGSSLHIDQLECRNLVANIDDGGHFLSKDVKCRQFTVYSKQGNITCNGYVIGNAHLMTGESGLITVHRVQGNDIIIHSKNGDVKAQAIYCKSCNITSDKGDVVLSNIHGNCDTHVKNGHLRIAGIEGNLKACVSKGDAGVHVAQLKIANENVIIVEDGNLDLSLHPQVVASVRLEAKDVVIGENVECDGQIMKGNELHVVYQGHLNGAETSKNPLIVGMAHNGNANFDVKTWFSTFKTL